MSMLLNCRNLASRHILVREWTNNMKKFIVEVTKPHNIVIHMQSLQVNGSPIPNTEYDTVLDRKPGMFLFKTAKKAKDFVDAYVYKGRQP